MTRLVRSLLLIAMAAHAPTASAQTHQIGEQPMREIGVSAAAWSLMNADPGKSLSGRYTRRLFEGAAVEGTLDLGEALNRPFGMAMVQVRAHETDWRDRSLWRFATLGVALGFASPHHPNAPRGVGSVLGFGGQMWATKATAIRADVQFMVVSHDYGAIRLTIGLVRGRH